jgi:hypothetical protein
MIRVRWLIWKWLLGFSIQESKSNLPGMWTVWPCSPNDLRNPTVQHDTHWPIAETPWPTLPSGCKVAAPIARCYKVYIYTVYIYILYYEFVHNQPPSTILYTIYYILYSYCFTTILYTLYYLLYIIIWYTSIYYTEDLSPINHRIPLGKVAPT